MSDLSEFLLARIAEDERTAREAAVDQWGYAVGATDGFAWTSLALSSERDTTPAQDEHIARWPPARVLAECAAKRRIVEAEQDRVLEEGLLPERLRPDVETDVIRLLALPYASHPDFREEWRP